MTRKGKLTAILAVLLIVVVLIAPFVTGEIFKNKFRTFIHRWAQQSSVPITLTSYDQGWFESTAITRVGAPDDSVPIKHAINHNPFSTLAFAVIQSTPLPADAAAAKRIAKYFGDKPPWSATSRVEFFGDLDVHVQSPELTQPIPVGDNRATVIWHGLTANIQVDDAMVDYSAHMPKLAVRAANGGMGLTNISVHGSMTTNQAHVQTHVTADRVRITTPELHTELALKTGFQGDIDENGNYNARYDLEIRQFMADYTNNRGTQPFKIKQATLQASMLGIRAGALRALMDKFKAHYDPRFPQSIIPLLATYLPRLLTDDSRVEVNVPQFASNHGQLEIHSSATLEPQDSGKAILPIMQIAARLNFGLKLAVDKSLARFALEGDAQRTLPLLVKQNILELRNGRYTMQLKFDGPSQLTINGHPGKRLLNMLKYMTN